MGLVQATDIHRIGQKVGTLPQKLRQSATIPYVWGPTFVGSDIGKPGLEKNGYGATEIIAYGQH